MAPIRLDLTESQEEQSSSTSDQDDAVDGLGPTESQDSEMIMVAQNMVKSVVKSS